MESKKRKVVHSEGREMIASVYHFLKKEYEFTLLHLEPNCDVSHLRNITQRTAEATGVSERTVARILREEKDLPSTSSKFPSPMKNRKKRSNKEDDGFKFDVVLNTIKEEKDLPSTPSSKCQSPMKNRRKKSKKEDDGFTADAVLSKIKQEKDLPSPTSSEFQSMIDSAPTIKEEKDLPNTSTSELRSPMKNQRNKKEDVDVIQSAIKEEPAETLDVAHFTIYEIDQSV